MEELNNQQSYGFDLFVVGNGFDKALGYPTSYEDFYNAILLVKEHIGSFDEFSLYFENGVNRDFAYEFYALVKNNLVKNYYLQYIVNFNLVFKRWCDFETELAKILHSFDYILSMLNPDPYSSNYEVQIKGKLQTLNICSSHFDITWNGFKFVTYDDYVTATLRDLEYRGPYNHYSLVNRIEEIQTIIINGLKNDLEVFKSIFVFYLKLVIKPKQRFMDKVF